MGNEKNNEGDKKPVGKAQAKKKTPKKTTSTSKKTSSKRAPKKAAKKITKKLTTEDMLSLMKSLEEDADLQEYKKTVRAVNSKIYEYLNSYIVIGYTQKGEPVQITSASTPQEYDALGTAIQKYIFDHMPKDTGGPF